MFGIDLAFLDPDPHRNVESDQDRPEVGKLTKYTVTVKQLHPLHFLGQKGKIKKSQN